MKAVGIDGCKGGWLATLVEGRRAVEALVCLRFSEALEHFAGLPVLIDIPIGLLDGGPNGRACDLAARRQLGFPRASSVFPAPSRAVLSATNFQEAGDANQAATGKRLSIQTWNILPKIREVDAVLRDRAPIRLLVREAHPELCFLTLNGGVAMRHNKTRPEGKRERRAALERWCPNAAEFLDREARRWPRSVVAVDDLHDSLVLALTAAIGARTSLQTVPKGPPKDGFGLPMEMCYCVWEDVRVLSRRGAEIQRVED